MTGTRSSGMPTDPQAVAFRGSTSENEWLSAARLIRSVSNQADPRNLAVFWVLTAMLGLGIAGFSEYRVLGAFMAAGSIWLWWTSRSADSRHWRRTPALREERWGTLSPDGLELSAEGTTTSVSWERVPRHASAEDVVVIEFAQGQFTFLSRSMFPDQDAWLRARNTVSGALPRASKLFSNLPPGKSRVANILKGVATILALVAALFLYVYFAS